MSASPPPPATPAADAWTAARTGAIVAGLDAGLLSFSGPDAAAFLHNQLSSDVKALSPGQGQRSTYNSPKGRMLATLFIGRPPGTADRYEALVAADLAEPLRKQLAKYVMRSKVVVADESAFWSGFGIAGPGAAGAVSAALGPVPAPAGFGDRDGTRIVHLPEGRFVVLAPLGAAAAVGDALRRHATPAPPDVWDWAGILAGVPQVKSATQDLFVAQTANQDALGGIDFGKGCYPGQEIVARTQYLGHLKERLYLLTSEVAPPAPGTRLYSPEFGDQACGTVVNSAPAPGGGSALLAVARVDASASLALDNADGPRLRVEPLPYALPEPAQPRGRVKL